jgi:hypothetical protein
VVAPPGRVADLNRRWRRVRRNREQRLNKAKAAKQVVHRTGEVLQILHEAPEGSLRNSPDTRPARPITGKRLSKAYSFLRDLQGATNRLLFKSCSSVKLLKLKALYRDGNFLWKHLGMGHFKKMAIVTS